MRLLHPCVKFNGSTEQSRELGNFVIVGRKQQKIMCRSPSTNNNPVVLFLTSINMNSCTAPNCLEKLLCLLDVPLSRLHFPSVIKVPIDVSAHAR